MQKKSEFRTMFLIDLSSDRIDVDVDDGKMSVKVSRVMWKAIIEKAEAMDGEYNSCLKVVTHEGDFHISQKDGREVFELILDAWMIWEGRK